jgi:hypothetical protein
LRAVIDWQGTLLAGRAVNGWQGTLLAGRAVNGWQGSYWLAGQILAGRAVIGRADIGWHSDLGAFQNSKTSNYRFYQVTGSLSNMISDSAKTDKQTLDSMSTICCLDEFFPCPRIELWPWVTNSMLSVLS